MCARTKPIIGGTKIKSTVLYQPVGMITPKPERMIAAPAYPPIKACEDEVGRPHHQVRRSHTIAPISPAMTTYCVTSETRIMPLPIVFATAVPNKNAATKLNTAAHSTASFGESTRVETTVAMLFAASWKPFRKSNARATKIVISSSRMSGGKRFFLVFDQAL